MDEIGDPFFLGRQLHPIMGHAFQCLQNGFIEALMTPFWLRIDHNPAAKGFTGRWTAQDIVITAYGQDGCAQFELQPAGLTGIEGIRCQEAQIGNGFGCAGKQFHFGMVVQWSGNFCQQAELHIQPLGGGVLTGTYQHFATPDLRLIHAGKVDCDPAAGESNLFLLFVGLETADPGAQTGRQDLQLIAQGQSPV